MTVQHECDAVDQTRERLQLWGRWLRDTCGVGMGGNVIAMYDERIGGDAQGLVLMPDNAVAERIERILCRLKKQQPKVFKVLWWWYYGGVSVQEIADQVNVSPATVKSRRLIGEASVTSYWDAGYGETDSQESLKKSA